MNVFELRDQLINEYRRHIDSFIQIRDTRIKERVDSNLSEGRLWLEPSVSLNPAFATGGKVDDLVDEGVLHPGTAEIFRIRKSEDNPRGEAMSLYQHQVEAVRAAANRRNYVLTTGTGSGKSLTYIVPIVDHVLRNGTGRGVQAIVVYPMNSLANSQEHELAKFLGDAVGGEPPVKVRSYTGQQTQAEREELLKDAPDVILTNYVMLELILTRLRDRQLVEKARGLRFLVLDELHTYRGRQGADVALLVRRLREACDAADLQCVGTSATLATKGSYDDQRQAVATMASTMFGAEVQPTDVIGETLRRATRERDHSDPDVQRTLGDRVTALARKHEAPPGDYDGFVKDPLSSWVESTLGVRDEDGRLTRATPLPLKGKGNAADQLREITGLDEDLCAEAIERQLMAGFQVQEPVSDAPAFAFRLHQFISKGDTVYSSLEPEGSRYSTLNRQLYVPGYHDGRVLLPLAFCRACGQEYYTVTSHRDDEDAPTRFIPRELGDHSEEADQRAGFLFLSTEDEGEGAGWPEDEAEVLARVPDDWLEVRNGTTQLKRDFRDKLPRPVRVDRTGTIDHASGLRMWWLDAPFRLCLRCQAGHSPRASDMSKLSTLGTEGRSTVTTVLSQATVRALRDAGDDIEAEARKLLLFTDNRQDASLQAGHFNDFVRTVQLRGALYRAMREAGDDGLTHEYVAERAFKALDLPFASYSVEADLRYGARHDTELTMQRVLGHLIYADLERGWRLTQPNLEQCGLLEIHHRYLDEVCADDDLWRMTHPALAGATPDERATVAKALLDFLRRERAIQVDYLDADWLERLKQQSNQQLDGPWALGDEEPPHAGFALPRGRRPGDFGGATYVSGRGGFGRFLRRPGTFESYGDRLSVADADTMIPQLFEALRVGGLVVQLEELKDGTPRYRVQASAMVWRAGSGEVAYHDQVRVPAEPDGGTPPNRYFSELYRQHADQLHGLQAAEHTAQVSYIERVDREERFRAADLPVLYCSPTMELGIDIADLNVVGLRNVPPTPANYAQRSGRAGRSGQPALVFTYCSAGSPHDQWFFRRPHLMVSGQVETPRLDLTNEDLVRSHVQAIWLSHSGLNLGNSLIEVMDVQDDPADPRLPEHVLERLHDPEARRQARAAAERALKDVEPHLRDTEWWGPAWLDDVLAAIPDAFLAAVDRWRALYRAAVRQHEAQNRIALDASATADARRQAARLRAEAERQLDLLRASGDERGHSDFYSYRYFASEGFLPGYSFPRLPLSAFIPGATRRRDSDGNFVSRPRFLAISEFGPRALVYHEGSRYEINRVILPASERPESDTEPVLTGRAKRCERCGYVHDGEALSADLCVHCGVQLPPPMTNLFRLQNVSTRRRDRINSDEEERQRLGFELQTGVRFAERGGRLSVRNADVRSADGAPLARLTYGETATLWRVNLGRRRRKNDAIKGFPLDVDRGYWAREKDLEDSPEPRRDGRFMRVVPYVEDSRNCLVLEPGEHLDLSTMASLQAALKSAIQLTFNLEDDELAAEPLPGYDDRRTLLFYESAEGGAGVLRRLVEEPEALAEVARKALELCHFDPDTGADQAGAQDEPCVAACYDCLLSYRNQPDHLNLDRMVARDRLRELARSVTDAEAVDVPEPTGGADAEATAPGTVPGRGSGAAPPSEVEQRWLAELSRQGLRPPDRAGVAIEAGPARPDFLYDEAMAAVYVDGPPHEHQERQRRDEGRIPSLRDAGYSVIRFGHADDWPQVFDTFGWVFGKGGTQ